MLLGVSTVKETQSKSNTEEGHTGASYIWVMFASESKRRVHSFLLLFLFNPYRYAMGRLLKGELFYEKQKEMKEGIKNHRALRD